MSKKKSKCEITNNLTLMYRQVHPHFIDGNTVSSKAFEIKVTSSAWRPNAQDEGMLSVHDSSKTSAKDAYALHITKLKPNGDFLQSGGVWSVTVSECNTSELRVYEDPCNVNVRKNEIQEQVRDEAHALIDFSEFTRSQQERKAKRLKYYANLHGPTYIPNKLDETEESMSIETTVEDVAQ